MQSKHCLTSVTLPDSFTIFGTNIKLQRIKYFNWKQNIFRDLDFKEPHWENRIFKVDFKLLYSFYLSTKYKSKETVFSSDLWRQSHACNETDNIH